TVTGSALRVLLQPAWRMRLVLMALVSALLAALLQPAGLLFTVFASDTLRMGPVAISALIIVSGVAGAVSYLAGGYLTDRFGRRALASLFTAGTSVAASLSFVSGTVGFVAGNVIWSTVASAATPVFGAWSAELFPTRARASAEAAKAVAWAAGSIVGLQAVGFLSTSIGLGPALVAAGVFALAGSA